MPTISYRFYTVTTPDGRYWLTSKSKKTAVKEATEEYGVPVLSVERGASFNDPHIGKQKEIDYE